LHCNTSGSEKPKPLIAGKFGKTPKSMVHEKCSCIVQISTRIQSNEECMGIWKKFWVSQTAITWGG
jgi:hypothetical protein